MPVVRPTYKEGQILGAADLNAQLTYERLGAVLHERTEHLWGVAQGLELTTATQTLGGAKYVDVSVAPGRAVDRLGRSIVVIEAIPLDPDAFHAQFPSAKPTELYPVFVQAIEVPRQGETQPGKCAVALTTRIEERVQVVFGPPGAEVSVLDPPPISVADGFGTPILTDMVLVGWVKFNGNNNLDKFIDTATQGNGTEIRYVGVVASDVVAPGGELALHTRPSGSRFALSIAEDGAGGCMLKFGKQDGSSPVVDVLRVDEKGNLRITGQLTPAPVSNTQAESGVTFDGFTLPLPASVTDPTSVRLHIMVTPWPQVPQKMLLPGSGTAVFAVPAVETCSVDPDTLLVSSSIRWYDPKNAETAFTVVPNACSYLVIASGK